MNSNRNIDHQQDDAKIVEAVKTIVELQSNNNEMLREHISQMGRVVLWIGRNLDGFDHSDQDYRFALQSITILSNVAALLQSFEAK
jgi:hypothetical protein